MSPAQRVAWLQAGAAKFNDRNATAVKQGETTQITLKVTYVRGALTDCEVFDHEHILPPRLPGGDGEEGDANPPQ